MFKSLFLVFLMFCKIEAQEFFNQDEETFASAGEYFYPRNGFAQFEPAPKSSEDGKVSKRKF